MLMTVFVATGLAVHVVEAPVLPMKEFKSETVLLTDVIPNQNVLLMQVVLQPHQYPVIAVM